jgi:hypothetical protein
MSADRLLRGCSGLLTGGLATLFVVLVGCWAASMVVGTPGPGGWMLLGHLSAAGTATGLQRVADRRHDRVGVSAAVGVVIVTVLVALIFWWG